jgi:hypothetical protein
MDRPSGQEKIIFFLGAQPGDKNNEKFPADQRNIFVLNLHVHKYIVF